MKRLTKRIDLGNGETTVDFSNEAVSKLTDPKARIRALFKALAEYEDLEEYGKLVKFPCAVGDTVYDVVLCDDKNYRITEMKVCDINYFGDIRKGKVWNVYLEDDYSKAYRSFYDFGKTVFLTQKEAEAALKLYRINYK